MMGNVIWLLRQVSENNKVILPINAAVVPKKEIELVIWVDMAFFRETEMNCRCIYVFSRILSNLKYLIKVFRF